jgi:hypothetical protein
MSVTDRYSDSADKPPLLFNPSGFPGLLLCVVDVYGRVTGMCIGFNRYFGMCFVERLRLTVAS